MAALFGPLTPVVEARPDGVTYVRAADGASAPATGNLVRARIVRAREYDLDGEVAA